MGRDNLVVREARRLRRHPLLPLLLSTLPVGHELCNVVVQNPKENGSMRSQCYLFSFLLTATNALFHVKQSNFSLDAGRHPAGQ